MESSMSSGFFTKRGLYSLALIGAMPLLTSCLQLDIVGTTSSSTSPVQAYSIPLGETVLHSFSPFISGATGGGQLAGALILSGSTLYGLTSNGGASGYGTVFSIGTDGSGFTLLHSFTGSATDGRLPVGSLLLSGGNLYGVTALAGAASQGTIFSIGTDGSGFSLIHSFTGGIADGATPTSSLIISGSTLYGTTQNGGSAGVGTAFSIGTNGAGFALIHTFTAVATNGECPNAALILSGATLYGTTRLGGSNALGTVFSVGTNGAAFTLLHSFTGVPTDGTNPGGSLLLSGSTLFGVTNWGGTHSLGNLFSIQTNGTGFTSLYSFTGGTDGTEPDTELVLSGGTLYGAATSAGSGGGGTVFSIGTGGAGFTVLHSFVGGANGSKPVSRRSH